MFAVEAHNLVKRYKSVQALNSLNFTIDKGEMYGFIGPDGAGKTSLFRILTSLLIPDEGSATVLGYDVVKDYREIRKISGYMPGRFSLYPDLSVEENLQFFASVFKTSIEENYHMVKDIYSHIEPFKKRRAGKLSGGMKQKLALSCALIHKPEILFLDEPTTGVDPVSRQEFWEMLARLKKEGLSIVVSTPYMDEASLCARIAMMYKGDILAEDSPEAIQQMISGKLWSVSGARTYDILRYLRTFNTCFNIYPFGQNVHFQVSGDAEAVFQQIKNEFQNIQIVEIQASVEDVFLHLSARTEEEKEVLNG
ncbi:MAG: ABC transporter ATP-binding protein [Bacteroidales bacterium]|nr:ABC transporter ATP-binding protein [Bacteroidales bacterium]